jgi:hypothetical protein
MLHSRRGELVDFRRSNAWSDKTPSFMQDGTGNSARGTHDFQVPLGFEILTQGNQAGRKAPALRG